MLAKSILTYDDYVCPHCFNRLEECVCEFQPYTLICIDRLIQNSIRILNEKGYQTTYCCESHSVNDAIYVSFARDYGIGGNINVPSGFVYKKSNTSIYYMYKKNTDVYGYLDQKGKQLKILLDWCKKLPYKD